MLPERIRNTMFVILLLLAQLCMSEKPYSVAPNCARFECVPYAVEHSYKTFEIRRYEQALWLSGPTIPSVSYRSAASTGFLTLFRYYNGSNVEQVKINMTIPVLIDVLNSTYTVNFYAPRKYQNCSENPLPRPDEHNITKVLLPKHKLTAVTRFSGNLTDDTITQQVAALRQHLNGTAYEAAAAAAGYTVAAYNSPFELQDRVNEIFLYFDKSHKDY